MILKFTIVQIFLLLIFIKQSITLLTVPPDSSYNLKNLANKRNHKNKSLFRKVADNLLQIFDYTDIDLQINKKYEYEVINNKSSEAQCDNIDDFTNYFFDVYSNNSNKILYREDFETLIRYQILLDPREEIIEQKAKQNKCKRKVKFKK